MINRLTVMIFSFILLSSIGMYLLVENSKPSEKPELMADANIGNIESAKGIQEFAYLDKKQEVIPFLEVEMKKQEEDKKKEEERLRKIEEEKARIEAEKKAKEEAERKAKEEAERKAKEEAEAKARETAEQKAREEAIKKERERQQQLKSSSSSSSKQSNQAVSANTSDLEALAKIIHAEAKGEPYQGKVAVGAVILNRVSDSRFPNSIKGVITAPGQFQPVRNGAYQNARPSDADYSAAREALAGADPTGGATFFYAPSIATTSWHETLTPTVTIGGHRFFKN